MLPYCFPPIWIGSSPPWKVHPIKHQRKQEVNDRHSLNLYGVRSRISAPIFRLLSPSSILRKRFFTISRSIIPAYRIIPSRKQTWKPSIGLKSRNMLQPAGTLTLIHYNKGRWYRRGRWCPFRSKHSESKRWDSIPRWGKSKTTSF